MSRNNALLDAYGISMNDDGLIHPASEPYIFPPISTDAGILGAAIVRYPLENMFGVFAQSKDGSIRKIDVECKGPDSMEEDDNGSIASCNWSDEMQVLSEAVEARFVDPEIDSIAVRDSIKVDLYPFYERESLLRKSSYPH